MVGKPVNPKCGLRVECVGNRHDDTPLLELLLLLSKQRSDNRRTNLSRLIMAEVRIITSAATV